MKIHWQTQGDGQDIVLLHGWGMNGAVWTKVVDTLSKHYRVHTLDFPGHGLSQEVPFGHIQEVAEKVLEQAPEQAIYVGWSLGGVVATYIAIHYPQRVGKLMTVASSPRFFAEKGWRGMLPKLILDLGAQMQSNFQLSIEGFMALQTLGSPSAKEDLKTLKKQMLSRPMPTKKALRAALDLLGETDLRGELAQLTMPFYRLYGRLDRLVPISVADSVQAIAPNSEHYIFQKSSHAPFMTEYDLFCQKLVEFVEGE